MESGWGNDASRETNNYFGIMGGNSQYKTSHGTLREYGSISEGVAGYFDLLENKWPGAISMMKGSDFSSDVINKALNTGPYQKYPAYFKPLAGQSSDYGGKVKNQMNSVISRMTVALDYAIEQNTAALEKDRTGINEKIGELIDVMRKDGDTKGLLKEINKAVTDYRRKDDENNDLKRIRGELDIYKGI
jgi:hypothetical protein